MYDAFISYASQDVEWARRVVNELQNLGIKVFWDRNGLVAGAPWDLQLMMELQQSRNIVFLWSDHARASDWVTKERERFNLIRHTRHDAPDPERKVIYVNLQGANAAERAMQSVDLLQTAYDGGPEKVELSLWRDVAVRVRDAIMAGVTSIPVPLAIFAMTAKEYEALDRNVDPDYGATFDKIVEGFEAEGGASVAACYGAQRTDWRPFGSGTSIVHLLEQILADVNKAAGEPGYRWQPVDLLDAPREEARKLVNEQFCRGPAVVMVDPLSLYKREISQRLGWLGGCGSNDHALVAVLAPVSTPQSWRTLREVTRSAAASIIEPYYVPPVPHQPHPLFAVNVSDEFDASRLIRASLGRYRAAPPRGTRPTPGHTFLRAAAP